VLPVPCLLLALPLTLVPVVPCMAVLDPSPELVPDGPFEAPSWPAEVPGDPPGAPAPVCAHATELPIRTLITLTTIASCITGVPYFLFVGSEMSGFPAAGFTDELLSGILSLP
jgi:hypothetical protein